MTTTNRDDAGLPEIAPEKPENAPRPRESYLRTPEAVIAPHGAEIPSRSSATPEEVVANAISVAARGDMAYGFSSDALGKHIVSLEAQLADVTTDRDALREIVGRKDAKIAELGSLAQRQDAAIETISSRIAQLTAERDQARKEREEFRASGFVLEDNLAQVMRQLETATAQLADVTAERDAAAENARRERDRRGTYTNDDLVKLAREVRQTILILGNPMDDSEPGAQKRRAIAEVVLRAHGLRSVTEERPVVRVVTSPRFYSGEQRDAARQELSQMRDYRQDDDLLAVVDTVAEALGMRRAQS